MNILIDTFRKTGNLHHAYVLEGNRDAIRKKLISFIEDEVKIPIQANPDVWQLSYETFAIDDARILRDTQAHKSMQGSKKIFIIDLQAITIEAQNSLLKVFEEPTADTHFFIITPTSEIFLPTLRSRIMIIRENASENNDSNEMSKKFLDLSIPERLKEVSKIVEEKNKGDASKLIDGLIRILHKKPLDSFKLDELLKARMYLNDRSPSLKLLLEHISLIL